ANYYEALAYCQWRSEQDGVRQPYRLLQEKEHIAIREPVRQRAGDWSEEQPQWLDLDRVMVDEAELESGYEVNNNLHFGSESPVDRFAPNSLGFHDVFGNVWQWCEDAFHPLPGFRIHPYYVDFSTPCYDNEHQMILGGSFISTGDEASIWARFHFRPHFFQHAGFRIVQGLDEVPTEGGKRYETDALLNQYLLFHYGSREEQQDKELLSAIEFPQTVDFIKTMTELVSQFAQGRDAVLDLGCATGAASFELARDFAEVTGLDYSETFISAAQTLQQQGSLPYQRLETGRFATPMIASVADDIQRSRVRFVHGDAAMLDAVGLNRAGYFDAVLLSNLMCRLPDPAACLKQFTGVNSVLKEGGVLVLSSPNTWMEQYTAPEHFLDGENNAATLAQLAR